MSQTSPKTARDRAAFGEGPLNAALRARAVGDQAAIADILTGARSAHDAAVPRHPGRHRVAQQSPASTLVQHAPSEAPVTAVADLGVLVKKARNGLGLTQQRFADLAGVGRRFVSELEGGKASVETDRVLRCCRAAGIDLVARPRRP